MKKKSFLALLLVFVFLCGTTSASAAIPSISSSCYIKAYPLSTQNNTYVYTSSSLNQRGTSSPYKAYNAVIYASDELYVYSMNETSAYISYPTSSGRRYGYVKTSDLTALNHNVSGTVTSRTKITTYKKPNGATYGSISKGDNVYIVATSGKYTQVIYPVSGGYKMAWIKTSDYNSSLASGYQPEGCVDSIVSNGNKQITLRGWSFDRDNCNTSLTLHVYVGGPAGDPNASVYVITANTFRPDVQQVFGVGEYHGFDCTINVDKSGTQDIYVYAINTGAGSTNPMIGMRTVTIQGTTSNNIVRLNVPSYKQYDSRWAEKKIGNKTIGQIGCLLVSLSMKYSYQTGTIYPEAMKSKLSFSNNDIYWSSISNLGYTYTSTYDCKINQSIMQLIYQKLREGKPVIIGGTNSSNGMHWVVVTGYQSNVISSFNTSAFTINDPNSASRTTLQQFLNSYPYIERLIY